MSEGTGALECIHSVFSASFNTVFTLLISPLCHTGDKNHEDAHDCDCCWAIISGDSVFLSTPCLTSYT